MSPRYLAYDVEDCPRCGMDHEDLEFFAFDRPVAPPEMNPIRWVSWATCPVTLDPVLHRAEVT